MRAPRNSRTQTPISGHSCLETRASRENSAGAVLRTGETLARLSWLFGNDYDVRTETFDSLARILFNFQQHGIKRPGNYRLHRCQSARTKIFLPQGADGALVLSVIAGGHREPPGGGHFLRRFRLDGNAERLSSATVDVFKFLGLELHQ